MHSTELVQDVMLLDAHTVDDDIHHRLTVPPSELLSNLHIVQVVLQQFAFQVGKLVRNRTRCRLIRLQNILDFRLTALRLQLVNQLLCSLTIVLMVLNRFLLVIVTHLDSQMTRTRVDNDVAVALIVNVNFNEMVATAQTSYGQHKLFGINRSYDFVQIHTLGKAVLLRTVVHPGRNFLMAHLIKLRQVEDAVLRDLHHEHTAPDVNADQVRNDTVDNLHRQPNNTTSTGVAVRHNGEMRTFGKLLVHQVQNLLVGGLFQGVRIHLRRVKLSYDFNHNSNLCNWGKYSNTEDKCQYANRLIGMATPWSSAYTLPSGLPGQETYSCPSPGLLSRQ